VSKMAFWPYTTPGIPDRYFIRGEVPMTKEEVRAVTLAKARLEENSVVYDIGAGTGSVSIEAALLSPRGKVYAIERNPAGVDLIRQNAFAFGVKNIEIIAGEAPGALAGLPRPDRVIIGGSGGQMAAIVDEAIKVLAPEGRIVANLIVLENLMTVVRVLEGAGFEIEIAQVSVAKAQKTGASHMLCALNPVYIAAAERSKK